MLNKNEFENENVYFEVDVCDIFNGSHYPATLRLIPAPPSPTLLNFNCSRIGVRENPDLECIFDVDCNEIEFDFNAIGKILNLIVMYYHASTCCNIPNNS